jgi:hypothetical protein
MFVGKQLPSARLRGDQRERTAPTPPRPAIGPDFS